MATRTETPAQVAWNSQVPDRETAVILATADIRLQRAALTRTRMAAIYAEAQTAHAATIAAEAGWDAESAAAAAETDARADWLAACVWAATVVV